MPASLGGTREWVRTRKPCCSRAATVRSRRGMFWKTPPERATVPSPVSSRRAWQAATVTPARPLWKRGGTSRAAPPGAPSPRRGAAPRGAGARRGRGAGRGRGDPGRVGGRLGGVGQLLELDRGLALVVDRVADTEDRGHGVEQPAGAGGHRGRRAREGHGR